MSIGSLGTEMADVAAVWAAMREAAEARYRIAGATEEAEMEGHVRPHKLFRALGRIYPVSEPCQRIVAPR